MIYVLEVDWMKSVKKKVSSWHIGVAAEAFVAAQFARYGIDVSVQYGANQPEYDLIAAQGDKMLKISVKGSQDGGWGLTQGYIQNGDYHKAINLWLETHGKKTVFCLVQFKNTKDSEMPRIYLATPSEIAEELHKARAGEGETVLREYHMWTKRSVAAGTVDIIPETWKLTEERAMYFMDHYAR